MSKKTTWYFADYEIYKTGTMEIVKWGNIITETNSANKHKVYLHMTELIARECEVNQSQIRFRQFNLVD